MVENKCCIEGMRSMPDNSVNSIVTDPPYELGFMGKGWDASGIAYSVEMWREALRVLKPGGHLLAFSGSRTYHRMTCAIEDAGFEVRDQIMWVYASGFPKSLDVSKAIDKAAGAEAAKQWQGWGTALKPAHEPICVARKPVISTVAANVLLHGTGALNIDGCRVATDENLNGGAYSSGGRAAPMTGDERQGAALGMFQAGAKATTEYSQPPGRWPANLIHDGSDEVLAEFPSNVKRAVSNGKKAGTGFAGDFGSMEQAPGYADACSAARFFYCAKANKADRGEGNNHPTVKPQDLMRYLCRLVTPPGGVVFDPFTGSGSTWKAAVAEGFLFTGFELSAEYCEIARARNADVGLFA